jgi:aspartate/glutamate racemase
MYSGGRTNYGQPLGILMLNTSFPRIPGDIGNATTFSFPVVYKVIPNANAFTVVDQGGKDLLEPFIEGARELQKAGVRAIATSCGFLAIFQKELAAAVDVPVFTSSLIQARLVYPMLAPDQKLGIITANGKALGERHFAGVGISDIPKVVIGVEHTHFAEMFFSGSDKLDEKKAEAELVEAAEKLVRENKDIGAIILECTNMPPYSRAIHDAVGLPVFDIVTLAHYVYSALEPRRYLGYM